MVTRLLTLLLLAAACHAQAQGHRRARHLNPRDAGASIAVDARFLSGLSDAAAVSTLTNRVGSNNLTQATSSLQPTYRVNVRASQPVIRFDGGDSMVSSSFTSSPSFTVVAVWSASANGMVYERGTSASVAGDHFLYTTVGASSFANGTTYPTNSSGRLVSSSWGIGSTWRVVAQVCDGTHAGNEVYINGVASTTGNQSGETNNPGTSSYSLALYLGSRASSSLFITGDIACFCLISPTVAAPLRLRLQHAAAFSFKIAQ